MNTQNNAATCISNRYACYWSGRVRVLIAFLLCIIVSSNGLANNNVELDHFFPRVRFVKSVQQTRNLDNGNLVILYRIGIKNTGTEVFNTFDIDFKAAEQIGDGFVGVPEDSPITIHSSSASLSPQVNDNYNGNSNTKLFQIDAPALLAEDDEIVVYLAVEINPFLVSWPLSTQVSGTVYGNDNSGNSIQAEDVSDSGENFTGNNPFAPGDQGTSDDATELTCNLANVNISVPEKVCPGKIITLDVSSSIENADYEWSVAGESAVLSNLQNPFSGTIDTLTNFLATVTSADGACFYDVKDSAQVDLFEVPSLEPETAVVVGEDCAPSTISFSANASAGDAPVVSYIWLGGDYGWASMQADPEIVNAHSFYNGIYVIEAIDTNGCKGIGEVEVTGAYLGNQAGGTGIIPLTNSDLDCEQISTQGVEITAPNYQAEGQETIYEWSTPEGVVSNIAGFDGNKIVIDPVDLTVHQGEYSVKITVGDCLFFSDTFNLEVFEIIDDPSIIIESNEVLCEGGSFKILANIENAVSYEWFGPNGFTSNEKNPIINNVTTADNGTYILTATSTEGCSIVRSLEMNEVGLPPVIPTLDGESSICEGAMISLVSNEVYSIGANFEWTNGSGAVISLAPQLDINEDDPAAVSPFQLKVTEGGCGSSLSEEFVVERIETPEVLVTSSVEGDIACIGQSVQLNASSVSGGIYQWRVQGDSTIISTEQNPIITPINNMETYELIVGFPECSATINKVITITTEPGLTINTSADFEVDGNCVPTAISLLGESTNETISTYAWSGPNGFSSSQSNPVISDLSELNNGFYTLVVTTPEGCTAMSTLELNNSFEETAQPEIVSGSINLCQGEEITLIGTEYTGANIIYEWTTPNGVTTNISGSDSRELTITNLDGTIHNGSYSLTVELDGCTLESETYELETELAPEVSITSSIEGSACSGESVQLSATEIMGASYEWRIAGTAEVISTERAPEFTSAAGTIVYEVSVFEPDCSTTSIATKSVSVSPAVTISTEADYTLDGNCVPTAISLLGESTNEEISSYAWSGPNGFSSSQSNPVISNLSELNNGVYTLVVTTPEGCTAMSTLDVNNSFEETAQPEIVSGSVNLCQGEEITLIGTEYTGVNIIYEWTTPNGVTTNISGSDSGELTITNLDGTIHNGSYALTVELDGCTLESETYELETELAPEVSITSSIEGSACSGESVQLSATEIMGASYEWRIAGTAEVISTERAPEFTSAAGTIVYEVSVFEPDCSTTSIATKSVSVSPAVTISTEADYTLDGNCVPTAISLLGESTNEEISSYAWSGPNGFSSSQSNPVISNLSELNNGFYTLVVTTPEGCTAMSTLELNNSFEETAQPEIVSGSVNLCQGEEITLIGTEYTGDNITYAWTTPNGVTTNISGSASHKLTITNLDGTIHNGSYSLTVELDGCTLESETYELETELASEVSITSSIEGSACAGEIVQLSATEIVGASYEWRIAGTVEVISTERAPEFTSAAGTIVYEVSVFEPDCSTTSIATKSVSVSPAVSISTEADYTLDGNCVPTAINLSSLTNVNTLIATYDWQGPDGFNSGQENPFIENITAANNGTYTLVITTAEGCTAASSFELNNTFEEVMTPIVSSDIPSVCQGESITLSVPVYNGDNVTYEWLTPGGVTSDISGEYSNQLTINNLNPTIHNGNYSVSIEVDGCTLTSNDFYVETSLLPQISPAIEENNIICEGNSFQLNANSSDATNFSWTGPDGFSSVSENPIISNAKVENNGTYTLLVIGDGGCVVEETFMVDNISSAPEVPEIGNTQIFACEGTTFELETLSDYPEGAITYEWTNNFGTIIGTSKTLTLTAGGASAVPPFNLTVSNGSCEESAPVSVFLDVIERPEFSIGTVASICEGADVLLTASAVSEASYEWRVLNEPTVLSSDQNPTIQDLTETTTFELTVSAQGCTSSQTTLAIVNPLPVIQPAQSYTLNTDCSPSDLTLLSNVTSFGDSNFSYTWTGPNGFSSDLPNPIISNAGTGNNGIYTLSVMNGSGCFTNGLVHVTGISETQEVPFISSNTNSFCDDQTIVLSVPAYEGDFVQYNWTGPGISVDSFFNNNQLIIQNANPVIHGGDYALTVQVDGCILEADPYTLQIETQPEIDLAIANNGTICSGENISFDVNAINAESFQWTGPSGFSSNETQPIIENVSVANNGDYTLTAFNSNGCSITETINISSIVGVPQTPVLNVLDEICEGQDIIIGILQPYPEDNIGYTWYNGAGELISTSSTLSINEEDEAAISPFSAMVTINGCDSELSDSRSIQVYENPVAVANNDGPACFGTSIQLQADAIEGATYYWYDSDPVASSPPATIISTQQSPEVNNLGAGSYTYYLIVENENGCASHNIAETIVEVLAQPILSNVIGDGIYCEGQTVLLSAINAVEYNEVVNYTWTGPNEFEYNGTAVNGEDYTLTILDFDQSMEGVYTLETTVNNQCVTTPVSALVEYNESPEEPSLSISNDIFCPGETLTLTTESVSGNVTYDWFFTDASGTVLIDATDFPTLVLDDLIADNSGTYTVRINVDGGCSSPLSNSETILVTDAIDAPIISNTTAIETPACEQGMVNLSASFIPGATYYWYGPDGFITEGSGLVLMDVSVEDAGAYYVIAEVNNCASVLSEETMVYINELPETPALSVSNACVGGEIILSIDEPVIVPSETPVVFEWYYQTTGNPFAVTSVPELTISDASPDNNGTYFVLVSSATCRSAFSNVVEIEVEAVPQELAIAGDDQSGCNESIINLSAELPNQSAGFWSSPSGASITDIDDPDTEVSDLEIGENIFVWSLVLDGCDPFDADTVVININDAEAQMAFAGDNIDLCDETALSLNALILPNTTGTWSQPVSQVSAGVNITEPSMSNSEVIGLESGNSYTFLWTVYDEVCDQYSEDEVEVVVSSVPANEALIPESIVYACGDDIASLVAIEPTIGYGTWVTNSTTANISNPHDAIVLVGDVEEGQTEFVWSLSYEACKDYSFDTLTLINETSPEVNDDAYATMFRESILGEDLLLNDNLENINDWEIKIVEAPSNGGLSENIEEGIMDYTPAADFYGNDRFVYEICNRNCPSDCSAAIVTISVMIDEEDDCWVPDVVTPNGDGLNDVLEIPCLANYPNNQLTIYNRWGDKVFEAHEYSNDWRGTYRGSELPPGTYYYFLKLEPDAEAIKGFLTLVR